MPSRVFTKRLLLSVLSVAVVSVTAWGILRSSLGDQAADSAKEKSGISGSELFNREWLPGDPRSHGGDGLGPVYNDSSCVACHNQGGPGGGGPASKNVDIVSAALNPQPQRAVRRTTLMGAVVGAILGVDLASQPEKPSAESLKERREQLVKEATGIHPGFASARSVVIHKFGTEDDYEPWRMRMTGMDQFFGMGMGMGGAQVVNFNSFGGPTMVVEEAGFEAAPVADEGAAAVETDDRVIAPQVNMVKAQQALNNARTATLNVDNQFFSGARVQGNFTLSTSRRNPSALFGAGLIDSIPVAALEAAAARKHEGFPQVTGRVARLPGGKVGRFGWKAQKASLYDFTMTACAVELGLNVPDHPQSGLPSKPDYKPAGFDLNQKECDALVDYLRNLPPPAARKPSSKVEAEYLGDGAKLFASTGCTACHAERLGEVAGIYSDLLLHDMGPDLGDTGDYGVFIPDSPGGDAESPVPPLAELETPGKPRPASDESKREILGASRLEWRTPPLWGVRDSAPYLHDGRAKNLEQAIAFHGGEGAVSARKYFTLSSTERQKVQAFLKSLVAPSKLAAP